MTTQEPILLWPADGDDVTRPEPTPADLVIWLALDGVVAPPPQPSAGAISRDS
jgi:hypothetical protein